MKKNYCLCLLGIAIYLFSQSIIASEAGITLFASSGDYGLDNDTKFTYGSVYWKYKKERWSFKLEIPYIGIDGPANVTLDESPVPPDEQLNRNESGLGDITIQARYIAHVFSNRKTFIGYSLRIKAPTADEGKSLGSGKTDYNIQTEFYHKAGNALPFLMLGYKVRGDTANLKLEDGFTMTTGLDYKMQADYSVGYLLQYREASTKNDENVTYSTLYGKLGLSSNISLTIYASKGHSTSSADYGFGSTLVFKF